MSSSSSFGAGQKTPGHLIKLSSEDVSAKGDGFALEYASQELIVNEECIAACPNEQWCQHKNENTMYDVWDRVPQKNQEEYGDQWEVLMASYYNKVE